MKARVRRIINEAKVQRTIDSKIWASMSSMSSRLRSTLAQDVKPMKRDTKEILLQKYVAGLLTMKVNCPNNINDITKNKAYQNIGNAFIDAGGTIQEIQKLYQQNGGVLTSEFRNDSDELEQDSVEDTQDYPEYDEVPVANTQNNFDSTIAKYKDKETQDYPEYDEVETKNDIIDEPEKDYPEYDDVDDDMSDIEDEQPLKFSEKMEDSMDMDNYFKTVSRSLYMSANKGSYLDWDEYDGFVISNDDENSIGECVGRGSDFLDKKPRFILDISDKEVSLNKAGNNSSYDDYYYQLKDQIGKNRIKVIPGSNYYPQEEKKGDLYTEILSNNGNGPANYVKSLDNLDYNNFGDLDKEQSLEMMKQLQKRAYLPTLPELAKAIEFLEPGKYWTSSIIDNGTKNIILQVQPDKVIITGNPSDKAKVVTFLKF